MDFFQGAIDVTELRRTPLFPLYKQYGAQVVDFAGYEMPVQYAGIIEEHTSVREKAGLFDVSHMGEIEVTGQGAGSFIQQLITNDLVRIGSGQAQYSPLANEEGGTVDDVLVYCLNHQHFWIVVNAANREKDLAWFLAHQPAHAEVNIRDRSDEIAQLALQGPLAETIMDQLMPANMPRISYYSFLENVSVAGVPCLVSRTGYTGEDGFEIYMDADQAIRVYEALMDKGAPLGLQPIGLGARDTLRLEAKLPLYGHELQDDISPLEAGLGYFVKLAKPNFVGRDALLAQKEAGLTRKIVGFELIDRGIARAGFQVWRADQSIGFVTSGTFSPTFNKSIGLAMVDLAYAKVGAEFEIEIRGKKVRAQVVNTPFYKRVKA
jgi:aminomethyltransferase